MVRVFRRFLSQVHKGIWRLRPPAEEPVSLKQTDAILGMHAELTPSVKQLAFQYEKKHIVQCVEAGLRRCWQIRTAILVTVGPTRSDRLISVFAGVGMGLAALLTLAKGELSLALINSLGYVAIMALTAGARLWRGG